MCSWTNGWVRGAERGGADHLVTKSAAGAQQQRRNCSPEHGGKGDAANKVHSSLAAHRGRELGKREMGSKGIYRRGQEGP